MENKPDTIAVSAVQREEIQATYADLFVSVKGSSLVSGEAALEKALEVKQLVEALGKVDLPAKAVTLQSVYAETSSGALSASSSATYHLKIRIENLDQFAGILEVITNQKNTTIEKIEWQYPDESVIETAMEKAIQKAETRARKVAAALSVSLLGVYDFTEKIHDQEPPTTQVTFGAQGKTRAMGVISQPDLGMNIQHSKTIEVRISVEYRVSGFAQP
ncbi:MAG TPA: SIMPL domain-containing protein [Anaerolineales bacterium]